MSKVKASDRVRLSDGTVGTVAALLDSGRLVVNPTPMRLETRKREGERHERVAYFIEEPPAVEGDPTRCIEISRFLWESRTR